MKDSFLNWIEEWYKSLKPLKLGDSEIDPKKTALLSVDMVKGFCSIGPLASPLVSAIIPSIVELFEKIQKFGVAKFLLFQDTHSEKTAEFSSYPPHCLSGSKESETIDELKNLPFSDKFIIFEKNSLSPAYGTGFDKWLKKHPQVENFIVVGNCTDLCIYSAAMHLRLSANAYNLKRRIIIAENCVATYDMPVQTAKKPGAMPHEASIIHKLFL
ncbi:nicotinamidase, partial [Candidatus Gottesmanbacteria bacterium RBG_16_37_8]